MSVERSGAEILVESLVRQGVEFVFGYPGGAVLPIYDALFGDSGVAYWAHAGGFIAGVVFALPLFFKRGGTVFWDRTHGRPPHRPVEYVRSRIPDVRR